VYHYLIGFAVFILINMVSILAELGVYEKSVHTQHASLVGAGFLVIIFGVGLANRITALKEEKERKEQENNLMEQSLKLSQMMLKETNHRIKNNLQLIYSLLNLQKKKISDKQAIQIIATGQNRIKVLSSVHELIDDTTQLDT